MILSGNILSKVSLTIALLWSAAFFHINAATPQTVDVKPFGAGLVIAYSDGRICFADVQKHVTDSIRLKTDIAGIDIRDDYVLAVTPDGMVYKAERNGRSRKLCRSRISGNADRVVGIACTKENTLILTEGGVIYGTRDFETFTTMDFNGTYYSYYDETSFCSIAASDNSFFIAGTYMNGMPAVFTSATGKIWSERTLTYTENGQTRQLELQPLRLSYDHRHDRFVLSCADGWLFYMPGCSHCNSLTRE